MKAFHPSLPAGAYRWNVEHMGEIAAAYTDVRHGQPVRVEWATTRRYLSEVANDDDGFVIRLNADQMTAEVPKSFFQAVGELLLYPPKLNQPPALSLADVARLRVSEPNDRWWNAVEGQLQKKEADTSAWADRMMSDYATEHGDFLEHVLAG